MPAPFDAADEARLLALARAGDGRAFGRLVDAHQSAVRAFARRLIGDAAEAEDIAQEAFARAWEQLSRLRSDASLRAFVCGVAYNIWRSARRSHMRRQLRERAYARENADAAEQPRDAPARLALRAAMDALPPDQRAALALCLGADFTHAEAASALNLPLGTVKSHVLRGRAKLREALGLTEEGEP
ncbi:MAG: sigma-70 family RNA polymerase sigma factor [Alphaproteobacteria bacterium]|nr:sigma-70 family RNA polymerase sigma factor [Alphaproteobacteria bacterium]